MDRLSDILYVCPAGHTRTHTHTHTHTHDLLILLRYIGVNTGYRIPGLMSSRNVTVKQEMHILRLLNLFLTFQHRGEDHENGIRRSYQGYM